MIHFAIDNGPEQGDLTVRVADGADVLDNWYGDLPCSFPSVFDPESGCLDTTWTVPTHGEFTLGVSIVIAVEDPASYALNAFTMDSGSGPVTLPIDLLADDVARPL